MTRDTVWHCNGAVCSAAKPSAARDAIMCELVVHELGTLTTFTAGGTSFDADALQKCNAKAK
ncbi:MAG: hypothetical protein WDN44_05650 [Sphingomonas sp.]